MEKIVVKNIYIVTITLIMNVSILMGTGAAQDGESVSKKVISSVSQTVDTRQKTQKKKDKWAAEKEKLTAQYLALEKTNRDLTHQNLELIKERDTIQDKVNDTTSRLEEITRISKELAPFLNQISQRLETMLAQGMPMLLHERRERLLRLKKILGDPDISISEQYRKTMEALFVEAEYGGTIEVYQDKIMLGEETILADIFRLGRLSLFCKTPDGSRTGYYDMETKKWTILDRSFNSPVIMAMEMGAKRRSMDFVSLPLGKVVVQ